MEVFDGNDKVVVVVVVGGGWWRLRMVRQARC